MSMEEPAVATLDDKDGKNPDPIKDPANDPHLKPIKPGNS
jgi:hypothetical protein